jgi:glycosyltransferase involved in cell wall biosynthesis
MEAREHTEHGEQAALATEAGSLKILQALGTIDAIGGAQRQVLAVAGRLDPRAVRSDVAWFLGNGELAEPFRATGAATFPMTRAGAPWDPIGVARATARIRAGRYDVVHCHLSRAEIVGTIASVLAEAAGGRRPKVILHKHNEDSWWTRGVLARVHRAITARADAIVVQSPRLAGFYDDPRLHVSDPSKIEVIPYGIDAAAFAGSPAHREAARARLREEQKWDLAAPVVVAIARLTAQKRLDVLIDAWPAVRRAVPAARLAIVGRGELEEDLQSRAQAQAGGGAGKSGESAIRLLGFREDIADLLLASDALALSSDWEGVPMTMLQAFAAGLPVVSTDVAGISDALADRAEGLLVPRRDPAALAAAIVATLTDRPAALRRAAAAESRVRRDFSLEAAARNWEALYARLARR